MQRGKEEEEEEDKIDWNEVEKYIQYRYDTIVEKRKVAAIQKEGPEVKWEVTNFVCTARTDEQIPIHHVATKLRAIIKYNPHSFAAAYLSLRFPEMNFRATVAIFATGQLVIRGTKHLEHAHFAALAVVKMIKKRCGIKYLRLTADSFRVHNIVAHIYMYKPYFNSTSFQLHGCYSQYESPEEKERRKYHLNLDAFQRRHTSAIYNSSLFPGLSISCEPPIAHVTCILFTSGRIHVMGANKLEQVQQAVDYIVVLCKNATVLIDTDRTIFHASTLWRTHSAPPIL